MHSISIGLTQESPCSYLPDQRERVAITIDPELHTAENYQMLLANGFRRSGATIYRPYCNQCSACQSIRIPVNQFTPSRNQKRVWNKSRHLRWEAKRKLDDDWYEIYAAYINQRHRNGSMYPPNKKEFSEFSINNWLESLFIHIYDDERLIGVAITDITPNCASAFYTFYDPDYPISLGTLGVLIQIAFCREQGKEWLYLGYQIDACPAMNYKVRFQPNQKLVNQRWQG